MVSDDRYPVLTHQTTNTAVTDIQTYLFEFLSHAWPTITAKTETRLFFNMRQRDQIRSLPTAGRTVTERPQTAPAYIHDMAHPPNGKCRLVFFPSRAFLMRVLHP
jgi:hypothetical protein